MEFEIPAYLKRPASGGWPSFWQAIEIMLVFPLLWLPVVADFARFGADSRSTVRGTFAGVFIAVGWFGILGILYLPATDSGDIAGFVTGMQLGLGALVLLFLLQLDEIYVTTRATVPTIETLGGHGWARLLPAVMFLAAIPAAIVLSLTEIEGYVLLVASIFIPGFAIVVARASLPAARPWFVPALAWALGFMLYQWISPAEIAWWQDAISSPLEAAGLPFPLSESMSSLGAAIPAFVLAFVIDASVPAVSRLRPTHRREAQATG
jgi:NCS1 family nucleobase:cation symporter-1